MQKLPFSISTLTEKSTNYTYLIPKYFQIYLTIWDCDRRGSSDLAERPTVADKLWVCVPIFRLCTRCLIKALPDQLFLDEPPCTSKQYDSYKQAPAIDRDLVANQISVAVLDCFQRLDPKTFRLGFYIW